MVNLNREFVIAKIESLGLRRWWVAEQLGINRRTLQRWLSGKTQQISDSAAAKLAAFLGCAVADLSGPEDIATHQDQLEAAKALAASDLLSSMSPGYEFALYTQLAKGMLVPGLDKQALGQLYMNIALAHFRQSELDEAAYYAKKAQQVASDIGDEHLWLRANMQLSYRRYLDGDARGCLQMDLENLALAKCLGDRQLVAANLSNVGDEYLDFGEFGLSKRYQLQAIDAYQEVQQESPAESALCFCYLGLANCEFQQGNTAAALSAVDVARQWANQGKFARGQADCDRFEARYQAAAGQEQAARAAVASCIEQYQLLAIVEVPQLLDLAHIYHGLGDQGLARRHLNSALTLAREKTSPMLEALSYQAMWEIQGAKAKNYREQAIILFTAAGLDYQVARLGS